MSLTYNWLTVEGEVYGRHAAPSDQHTNASIVQTGQFLTGYFTMVLEEMECSRETKAADCPEYV